MYETWIFVFEIIGTVSFAVSGALAGISKKMDLLGICMLGVITAVGGGIIRDIVLGITPPQTFMNPVYISVALAVSLVCCLPGISRNLVEGSRRFDILMLIMDSIGLGVFTVVGIETAYMQTGGEHVFLMVFVGAVTGVGGGVIRDVLTQERPYIFVKHFYASASIIGAAACCVLWGILGGAASMAVGTALIIVLRLCAAKFRWKLPVIHK